MQKSVANCFRAFSSLYKIVMLASYFFHLHLQWSDTGGDIDNQKSNYIHGIHDYEHDNFRISSWNCRCVRGSHWRPSGVQCRSSPDDVCYSGSYVRFRYIDKKEEIWPSPMTKVPTPTEMSKRQNDNTNNATKKFDSTAIADRLRTVSWSNYSHPTGVVNLGYGQTFPLPATAV